MNNQKGEVVIAVMIVMMVGMMIFGHGLMRFGDHEDHHGRHMMESGHDHSLDGR